MSATNAKTAFDMKPIEERIAHYQSMVQDLLAKGKAPDSAPVRCVQSKLDILLAEQGAAAGPAASPARSRSGSVASSASSKKSRERGSEEIDEAWAKRWLRGEVETDLDDLKTSHLKAMWGVAKGMEWDTTRRHTSGCNSIAAIRGFLHDVRDAGWPKAPKAKAAKPAAAAKPPRAPKPPKSSSSSAAACGGAGGGPPISPTRIHAKADYAAAVVECAGEIMLIDGETYFVRNGNAYHFCWETEEANDYAGRVVDGGDRVDPSLPELGAESDEEEQEDE